MPVARPSRRGTSRSSPYMVSPATDPDEGRRRHVPGLGGRPAREDVDEAGPQGAENRGGDGADDQHHGQDVEEVVPPSLLQGIRDGQLHGQDDQADHDGQRVAAHAGRTRSDPRRRHPGSMARCALG